MSFLDVPAIRRNELDGKMRDEAADPQSAFATELSATFVRGINVTAYGAKGDGVTDDTLAFNDALAAAAGKELFVPAGTYVLGNVQIPAIANLRMDEGATLLHKAGAASATPMLNFTGTRFRLRGGKVDGNRANQTNRPYIFTGSIQAGKSFDIEDVHFTGTVASIAYITNFGGYLNFTNNRVTDQAEHSGSGSDFTTIITVTSGEAGQKGLIRTNHNRAEFRGVPARAGSNPGGFFINTTTAGGDSADGNLSTWEAIGNYFYGYGQHDSVNDISPLHSYPTIAGARFADNYFEQCGFCAVSAKSVQDFVFTGNVILNGMVSAKNTASEGAISYVPGYKAGSFLRQRAVISNNIVKDPGGESATLQQNCLSVHGTSTSYVSDVVISNNVFIGGGNGINFQYVTDIVVKGNIITPGTGADAGSQKGLQFTFVNGTVLIEGNRVKTGNGSGIHAIQDVNTAKFTVQGNFMEHAAAGYYAMILRGMAYLKQAANTINATAGIALNVQADAAANKVGTLAYDQSNTILAGNVSINWPDVTTLLGRYPRNGKPTIAPGGAAGTDATATISAAGTDEAGYLTIVAGSASTTAGGAATVTFSAPRKTAPKAVILTPANSGAPAVTGYVAYTTPSTTSFAVSVNTAMAVNSTYVWHYQIID